MSYVNIAKERIRYSNRDFDNIITFIKNNVGTVNGNISLLYKLLSDAEDELSESKTAIPLLTAVLMDSGIDPLQKLSDIPNHYGVDLFSGKLVIPKHITQIGEFAFAGGGITELIISNGVQHIGEYAFEGCLNLEKVLIPISVKSIGKSAFQEMHSAFSEIIYEGTSNDWKQINIGKNSFNPYVFGKAILNIQCLDKTIPAY